MMTVDEVIKLLEKELNSQLPIYKAKRVDVDWDEWVIGYISRLHGTKEDGRLKFKYQFNAINNDASTRECYVSTGTVCRYTGSTDKKGNIIWEHDIVKQFADCDELGNDLFFYYEILWNEQYARFEGYEIYGGETVLFDELNDIEVIGHQLDNDLA